MKKFVCLILLVFNLSALSSCDLKPLKSSDVVSNSQLITSESETDKLAQKNAITKEEASRDTPSVFNSATTEKVKEKETIHKTTSMETDNKKTTAEIVSEYMNDNMENSDHKFTNTAGNTASVNVEDDSKEQIITESGSKYQEDMKKYSDFEKAIGIYETKNLPSEIPEVEEMCPAWIGVYTVGKSDETEEEIRKEFKKNFGYEANAKVNCSFMGEYLVDGFNGVQRIYQYALKDMTYPLLRDKFYVIKSQVCADGSLWVGFAVPGNLETMDTSSRVTKLLSQMNQRFCEESGYSIEYVFSNRDKFLISAISEAGFMRTEDGQIVEVVYRHTRGINMPIIK